MAIQVGTPQSRAPRTKAKRATQFERFSGWLTLAANLGVLVGLVLVILQLNQSEKMMRAQTRHEITMGIVEQLSENANNPQLIEAGLRLSQGGELTPVELSQLQFRIGGVLRLWEDEHYQYRMGLFDEEEFARERNNWKNVLATNVGMVAYWCRSRANFSAEFAADMDALMASRACATVAR